MSAFRVSSACGDIACGCGCVEVKIEASTVVLKDTGGHTVVYSHAEWAAFLVGVKGGEFELPAPEATEATEATAAAASS